MNTIHFIIYSCAVILLAFCYCFLGECLINEVIMKNLIIKEEHIFIYLNLFFQLAIF